MNINDSNNQKVNEKNSLLGTVFNSIFKSDATKAEDQIQNARNTEQKDNSNTATAVLEPEDAEQIAQLEGRRKKIEVHKEINKVTVDEIKSKKKVKIEKKSAKTLTLWETLVSAKNSYFYYLEKHHIFMLIGTIALFGSIALHELANVTILNKVFPDLFSLLKHGIATSVSVLFEALAITLVITRFKKASYVLDGVIVGMISWASYYELTVNQLDPTSSISRGVIGVSFFIGLMIIVHVIADKEAERKRQLFKDLKLKLAKELVKTLKESKEIILATKKQVTVVSKKTQKETLKDVYDRSLRIDYKALCSSYNLKSSELKKLSVRLGMYSNVFFKNPPKDRKQKPKNNKGDKSKKGSAKK